MASSERSRYGWYKGKLKRLWSESPMKWEAYARAKIKTGLVKCEGCSAATHWKMVEIDHIDSVVPADKELDPTDIATYAFRLNCPASKLQVLCEQCHQKKSAAENLRRKSVNKKSK